MQLTVTKTMAISMAVVEAARTTSRYFFAAVQKVKRISSKYVINPLKVNLLWPMANCQLPIVNLALIGKFFFSIYTKGNNYLHIKLSYLVIKYHLIECTIIVNKHGNVLFYL